MASYGQGGYGGGGGGAYDQGGYAENGYGRQQQNQYGAPPHQAGYGAQQPTAGGYGGGAQPAAGGYGSSGPSIMSNPAFLQNVEGVRKDIDTLSNNITQIAQLHQRAIGSPDASGSAQLENLVSQTQILNTRIRDQIKKLETDAARSGGNSTKDSQVRNLKNSFKSRLEQYQQEEVTYKKRYQEQIARQYRIVNPQASDEEVREAMEADWGDEGVFQTALRSNRVGAATSALGAVRARHNDIQKIERTLMELAQLFQDMAETVAIQEPMVQQVEQQTENVKEDTHAGNKFLDKGIKSARNARRLKWICCGIVTLVIVVLALALGIYFGVTVPNNNKKNNNNSKRQLTIVW